VLELEQELLSLHNNRVFKALLSSAEQEIHGLTQSILASPTTDLAAENFAKGEIKGLKRLAILIEQTKQQLKERDSNIL
jgi:hypothetical protein